MRTAFSALRTTTETVAVMPGIRRSFELSTLMMVLYVTTFCVMDAFNRILPTSPRKVSPGKASTVNVTAWPGRILPMSV